MTTATATDITMGHIASEVHGTGAGTMTLGIGTHGGGTPGLTPLGAITAGMIRSILEVGMTHGITADIGDITTLGTTEDGDGTTGTDIIIIHITADGTEAGIQIIMDISTETDTYMTSRFIIKSL